MRSTVEVIRTGIYSDKLLGGLSVLQCYISIKELIDSLPQDHLLLDRFAIVKRYMTFITGNNYYLQWRENYDDSFRKISVFLTN